MIPMQKQPSRFSAEWLAWTALRHFLSAPMLRELSIAIVDRVSDGTLQLGDLFDDIAPSGEGWNATWYLRPREVSSSLEHDLHPLAHYLRSSIRAFAWQSDVDLPMPQDLPESFRPACVEFEKALRLGKADLTAPDELWDDRLEASQNGMRLLAQGVKMLAATLHADPTQTISEALSTSVEQVERPLAAVILKHLGDLCADVDAWEEASTLYDASHRRLAGPTFGDDELKSSLLAIVAQSRAAAAWILEGPESAAERFRSAESELRESALFLVNASHDAMVATFEGTPLQFADDRRATIAYPPLLQASHDAMHAVSTWLDGNPQDAFERFWTVLRRQTALGATTQSRNVKALFARSTIDFLKKTAARQHNDRAFLMAVRLIVESGNTEEARQIAWDESLIGKYLTAEAVQFAIERAEAHAGSRRLRRRVVIELFALWIGLIAPDRFSLGASMLAYLATLARDEPSSPMTSANLGGRSLEILRESAETRPELRRLVKDRVAETLAIVLGTTHFWGGLEAARAYADAFADDELGALIDIVLTRLDELGARASPILRPAFSFLLSDPSKALLARNPDTATRIIAMILDLVAKETSAVDVLFYLHGFDPELLTDASVVDKLKSPIVDLRRRAFEINTSNTIEVIQALLIAPEAAGRDGVLDALEGLTRIIESAASDRPSIVLYVAYEPLILLASRHAAIASAIDEPGDAFAARLDRLFHRVVEFWKRTEQRPLLLAPFSIPAASVPNRVVTHNWTYASIVFAAAIGREPGIVEILDHVARAQPSLAEPILRAKATRSLATGSFSTSSEEIRAESRDAFYALLGRRLAALPRMSDEEALEYCAALLEQCIRQGPREIDAAVLALAARLGLFDYAASLPWPDYATRARRELGSTLIPLLESLGLAATRR